MTDRYQDNHLADQEVLDALSLTYSDRAADPGSWETDRRMACGWLEGSAPQSVGMRRFVLGHPILAGLAFSQALFKVAAKGSTGDEAYSAIVEHLALHGFPDDDRKEAMTRPVPTRTLEAARACRAVVTGAPHDRLFKVHYALDLAVRLPQGFFPVTEAQMHAFWTASMLVHSMEEPAQDETLRFAVDEGYGFGLSFSDDDIAAMMRDAIAGDCGSFGGMDGHALAAYGGLLAGYGPWFLDYEKGDEDEGPKDTEGFGFGLLKEALVRDGFRATMRRAMAFAGWDLRRE